MNLSHRQLSFIWINRINADLKPKSKVPRFVNCFCASIWLHFKCKHTGPMARTLCKEVGEHIPRWFQTKNSVSSKGTITKYLQDTKSVLYPLSVKKTKGHCVFVGKPQFKNPVEKNLFILDLWRHSETNYWSIKYRHT